MATLPDRISDLIGRLERGEQVTQADLARVQLLQALDLVVMSREFAEESHRMQVLATDRLAVLAGEPDAFREP